MGATLRQAESINKFGTTEQLFDWISQVRSKRIKWLRNRQRNIRVEAVLTYALSQAERELRIKQITKINKWQELKKKIEADYNGDEECVEEDEDEDVDEDEDFMKLSTSQCNNKNIWNDELYPELSSLDCFMSKINNVKTPLQR